MSRFQHGQGDNNILFMGKVASSVQEKVLYKVDTDPIVIQHEDERDEPNFAHQHLQSGVI